MICSKNNCTGCGACYNACPKGAIVMKEDEYGHIYPNIDESKCIGCNLCKKVCPELNNNMDFNEPIEVYALYNKNKVEREESSSGGAASLLYKSVLDDNGVIYGASNLFGNNDFEFVRINDIKDLYKVKGSKYVHCYIKDIFKNIKEDLLLNKKVLFIGTPCQVNGLKAYLMNEYENLYVADIICHGVPSQRLLFDEIKKNNIKPESVYKVSFRDEKMFNIKFYNKKDDVIFEEKANYCDYYRHFLKGDFYRDSCYNCKYARRERTTDLTLGDFWGLSKESKIYDDEKKGISLVLINTIKGKELFNKIKDYANIEQRNYEEAYVSNGQLRSPMKKNKNYDIYKKNYPKIGYKKTINKMNKKKDVLIRKVKKIIKKIIRQY